MSKVHIGTTERQVQRAFSLASVLPERGSCDFRSLERVFFFFNHLHYNVPKAVCAQIGETASGALRG